MRAPIAGACGRWKRTRHPDRSQFVLEDQWREPNPPAPLPGKEGGADPVRFGAPLPLAYGLGRGLLRRFTEPVLVPPRVVPGAFVVGHGRVLYSLDHADHPYTTPEDPEAHRSRSGPLPLVPWMNLWMPNALSKSDCFFLRMPHTRRAIHLARWRCGQRP
jgi:hypothetical protein